MKRHDIDLVSLVFGLIFVAVATWYFVVQYLSVHINLPEGGWFVAALLIILGVLGVAASLRQHREEPPPEE
jgi:hypothetical protein